jgi:hypothetical protein
MFQRNHFTEEDHFFLLVKETWEDHTGVWALQMVEDIEGLSKRCKE